MKSILYIVALILPGLALAQNDLKLKGHLIDGVDQFKSEEYQGASMEHQEAFMKYQYQQAIQTKYQILKSFLMG